MSCARCGHERRVSPAGDRKRHRCGWVGAGRPPAPLPANGSGVGKARCVRAVEGAERTRARGRGAARRWVSDSGTTRGLASEAGGARADAAKQAAQGEMELPPLGPAPVKAQETQIEEVSPLVDADSAEAQGVAGGRSG